MTGDLHSLQARRRAFRARRRAVAARNAQSGAVPSAVAADRRAGRARAHRGRDCGEALLGGAANSRGEDNRVRIAEIINSLDADRSRGRHEGALRQPAAGRAGRAHDAVLVQRSAAPHPARARAAVRQGVHRSRWCWRCAARRRISASPCCPRWRRARAAWSKANSPVRLRRRPPRRKRRARQIVKLVLVMAQRGEIELPNADDSEAA